MEVRAVAPARAPSAPRPREVAAEYLRAVELGDAPTAAEVLLRLVRAVEDGPAQRLCREIRVGGPHSVDLGIKLARLALGLAEADG